MNIWQRFMGWWRGEASGDATDDVGEMDAHSLRRLHGEEVPETGRSSVESNLPAHLRAANAFWGNVSPVISFEMLTQLKVRVL